MRMSNVLYVTTGANAKELRSEPELTPGPTPGGWNGELQKLLPYIIDPKGILVYKGAIDNRRSTDLADVKTATNYVKGALDAVMAGKKVPTTATQPYGCSVKYASK